MAEKTIEDQNKELKSQLKTQNEIIKDLSDKLTTAEAQLEKAAITPTVKVNGKTVEIRLKGATTYKGKKITAGDIASNKELATELVKKQVNFMVQV
jgi:hypothetical protein